MGFDLKEMAFTKEEIYSTVYGLSTRVAQLRSNTRLYANSVKMEEGRVLLEAKGGRLKLVVKELDNKSDANYKVYLNYFIPNGYKNYESAPKYMKDLSELEGKAKELVFGLQMSA